MTPRVFAAAAAVALFAALPAGVATAQQAIKLTVRRHPSFL